jgi:hypothetical protein
VDSDGSVHRSDPISVEVGLDKNVVLDGPNPNPIRRQGTLAITVRDDQEVAVHLYDVLGRRVKTLERSSFPEQETRTIHFNTQGLSSGTYFLRVVGDQFRRIEKMTVVK